MGAQTGCGSADRVRECRCGTVNLRLPWSACRPMQPSGNVRGVQRVQQRVPEHGVYHTNGPLAWLSSTALEPALLVALIVPCWSVAQTAIACRAQGMQPALPPSNRPATALRNAPPSHCCSFCIGTWAGILKAKPPQAWAPTGGWAGILSPKARFQRLIQVADACHRHNCACGPGRRRWC